MFVGNFSTPVPEKDILTRLELEGWLKQEDAGLTWKKEAERVFERILNDVQAVDDKVAKVQRVFQEF